MIRDWYLKNLEMLRRVFRCLIRFDDIGFSWLRIEQFPLPITYHQRYVKLLMELPGLTGFNNPDAYSFYLTKGLIRLDGIDMKHYYEESFYNKYDSYGYAHLCLHLKSFNPSLDVIGGDTLVDIAQTVYNFLAQKKGV